MRELIAQAVSKPHTLSEEGAAVETKRRNVSCPATSNQITVAVKSVATGFGAAVVIKGRRRRQLFARRPTAGIPRLTLCANGRDRHRWQRSEAA